MGRGRHWTDEELEFLEENRGNFSTVRLAEMMGRSYSSVRKKTYLLGIGGYKDNSEMLNETTLKKALGVSMSTINRFKRYGLKPMRKGKYLMYSYDKLMKFLKEHQDLWDATKVKEESIFATETWFREKKKRDRTEPLQFYEWSEKEIAEAIRLRRNKVPYKEIEKILHRPAAAIQCKVSRENSRGFKFEWSRSIEKGGKG